MKFSSVVARSFSTAETARLTGLTARQLDHWDRKGFVRPSAGKASGYGSARRYSFADVVRLRVAARLRASGVGLARIRRCADALAKLDPSADLGKARLLVVGSSVLWARSDREVVDLLKEGQLVLVCSLGDAVAEAAGAVSRLTREAGRNDAAASRLGERPVPGASESRESGDDVHTGQDGNRMRLASHDLSHHISGLARLGRQRDFSLPRFAKALSAIARNGDRGDVLRQLLVEWTGVPFEAAEALERWSEIERMLPALREKLGAPLGLQTVLLHHLHSMKGLLKEPRLVSEADLAVLRVNAITDPLTGLYNRRFLIDHLGREISRAERSGGILAVGMMDLKGFKSINDRMGHPVGDSVLVRTARIVRESLRAVDAGCRWGGDEFVLVLPNTDMISALAVLERVRELVGAMPLGGRSGAAALDLHYGVASYPNDGKSTDFLLKVADLRLYQCRSQSTFAREASGVSIPGSRPEEMSLRMEWNGRQRNSRAVTASVVDVSYRGLAFHAKKSEKWPTRWKAEIFQKNDPERHPIRLRALNIAPLPGGGVRVGCAYV